MGIFDVFKSRDIVLDKIINEIENDMANNYKDAAQAAFKELCTVFVRMNEEKKLNNKQKTYYSGRIEGYKHRLSGYTHKDQKPYWASK